MSTGEHRHSSASNGGQNVLTVKNLLVALNLLAVSLVGIVTWQSERMISKQDAMDVAIFGEHGLAERMTVLGERQTNLAATVDKLADTQSQIASVVTNSDKRITILERIR